MAFVPPRIGGAVVDQWACCLAVTPCAIRIQRTVRKWGSCSSNGIITLVEDSIERSSDFQDVAIVHESLHLGIPNHERLFEAVVSVYVPAWKVESVARSL